MQGVRWVCGLRFKNEPLKLPPAFSPTIYKMIRLEAEIFRWRAIKIKGEPPKFNCLLSMPIARTVTWVKSEDLNSVLRRPQDTVLPIN